LSLMCLVYFSKYQREELDKIRQISNAREDFFIAISSINLTSRLMSYLHMNSHMNMPASHNLLRAGRLQFKLFSKILSESKQAFFVLQSKSFLYLFYHWIRTSGTPPRVPPPNFEAVLGAVIEMVDIVLQDHAINNCHELQIALERQV